MLCLDELFVADIARTKKKYIKQLKALLVQTGVNVLGSVVNKQRHNEKDMVYSFYYSVDDSNDRGNHSMSNGHSPSVPAPSILPRGWSNEHSLDVRRENNS